MTNIELDCKLAAISEQVLILMRACSCDKTRIDDGLWERLCQRYREVKEYA